MNSVGKYESHSEFDEKLEDAKGKCISGSLSLSLQTWTNFKFANVKFANVKFGRCPNSNEVCKLKFEPQTQTWSLGSAQTKFEVWTFSNFVKFANYKFQVWNVFKLQIYGLNWKSKIELKIEFKFDVLNSNLNWTIWSLQISIWSLQILIWSLQILIWSLQISWSFSLSLSLFVNPQKHLKFVNLHLH